MTLSTSTFAPLTATPVAGLVQNIRNANRPLYVSILLMVLGMTLCLALMPFDARLVNGISTWDKPAKFFLSLIVQFATVSWALSQISAQPRLARGSGFAVCAMVIAASPSMSKE